MIRYLVRRAGALGDVLCATPVVRELRRLHPEAEIYVDTGHPAVFLRNPHVTPGARPLDFDHVISLDMAYERTPRRHVVDSYLIEAFGNAKADKTIELHGLGYIGGAPYIAIHAASSWRNRTMTSGFWMDVARHILAKSDIDVMWIGSGRDFGLLGGGATGSRVIDQRNKNDLIWSATLIANARCLIASDSSMIHLAGTTETPVVGIFTSAAAKYRMPYRHGELGWQVTAFEPDIECAGCLADEPAPATFCGCRRGDFACVDLIDPVSVADAALAYARVVR